MSKSGWGGRRAGAGSGGPRPGAGAPRIRGPIFRRGETLLMEREDIGGTIHPPQLVTVIGVSNDDLEIQIANSNEIVVIRRELPDNAE